MSRDTTPDSHAFPTRSYDLVKEFVIALGVVLVLSLGLAGAFGSPDEKAITFQSWAKAAPDDVYLTAVTELSGESGSAGYGAPYNTASDGQVLGPLMFQKWGGVRVPVDSANDLVIAPLSTVKGDAALTAALSAWTSATPDQQSTWATAYSAALGDADGDATKVAAGDYGPVPTLAASFVTLAESGGLEQLVSSGFFRGDETKLLLLLSDGTYLEDQARARSLGGDQWGMMNEAGNYPGQPWLWLFTAFYQVEPFASSDNADVQIFALMIVLTLILVFLPFIPGLRSIPQRIPLYRLIWRSWYRRQDAAARSRT